MLVSSALLPDVADEPEPDGDDDGQDHRLEGDPEDPDVSPERWPGWRDALIA